MKSEIQLEQNNFNSLEKIIQFCGQPKVDLNSERIKKILIVFAKSIRANSMAGDASQMKMEKIR